MKKSQWLIIGLIFAAFLLSGCDAGRQASEADLDRTFEVSAGQSARIAAEDMVITFDGVIGDNRMTMVEQVIDLTCSYQCPQKVKYVWDGAVNARLTITWRGEPYVLVLKQTGLSEIAEDNFMYYQVRFHVTPPRIEGEKIPEKDYKLTLTVTKQNTLDSGDLAAVAASR